jgi:hypothetical protein
VRRKWQTALGLVWLAAVLGGRASPSAAAWQSADGQSTAIGKTAKSTADADARVQTTAAAEAKAAGPVNGTPQGVQSAQPAATPTPELPEMKRLRLATLAVNLDYSIAFINFYLPRVTGTISLGKEKITHENAKEVLGRFQRERQALSEEIDREGFSNIGGDYDWHRELQNECKLKEFIPSDASGPVTAVQNGHVVEFKGRGLAGCGVVVGDMVVLTVGDCGGFSSIRLVGRVFHDKSPDQSIRIAFSDKGSGIVCKAGFLAKRSVER